MTRIALSTLVVAALMLPAAAEQRMTLEITNAQNHAVTVTSPGGQVSTLQLVVRNGDIVCPAITANYADGSREDVFFGKLYDSKAKTVSLRNPALTNLIVTCYGAKIHSSTLELTFQP